MVRTLHHLTLNRTLQWIFQFVQFIEWHFDQRAESRSTRIQIQRAFYLLEGKNLLFGGILLYKMLSVKCRYNKTELLPTCRRVAHVTLSLGGPVGERDQTLSQWRSIRSILTSGEQFHWRLAQLGHMTGWLVSRWQKQISHPVPPDCRARALLCTMLLPNPLSTSISQSPSPSPKSLQLGFAMLDLGRAALAWMPSRGL